MYQLVHEHPTRFLGLLRTEGSGQACHHVVANDEAPGVGIIVANDLLAEDSREHALQVCIGIEQTERAIDEPRAFDFFFFDLHSQAVRYCIAVFDFNRDPPSKPQLPHGLRRLQELIDRGALFRGRRSRNANLRLRNRFRGRRARRGARGLGGGGRRARLRFRVPLATTQNQSSDKTGDPSAHGSPFTSAVISGRFR